jgi:hypothetical protein
MHSAVCNTHPTPTVVVTELAAAVDAAFESTHHHEVAFWSRIWGALGAAPPISMFRKGVFGRGRKRGRHRGDL